MTEKTTSKKLKTTAAAVTIALIGAVGITASADAFGGKHRDGGRHGGMGGFAQEMMQGIDQNSDGTVTEAEVEAQLLNVFAMVDGDSSGDVTMEELKAAQEAKREARNAERGDKGGDKAEKRGKRHADRGDKDGKRGKRGERRMERMFDRFDADDSGSVTQEEFKTAIADYTDNIATRVNKRLERQAARFADMDTNNDGQISQEEYQAGRKGGRGNR
ncbi:MAG: EF-hand domain-containing protein [Hyphomicrobiales bacterium]